MRKSLLIMVVVLTAFSVEKVSASLSQNCCCSFPEIREKSLELNVGYRRDNLSWQFQDPSVRFLQTILPLAVEGILDILPITPYGDGLGPVASIATGVLEGILCKNATYHSDWSNLRMINVGGTAKAVTCDNFYARFGGNWAYIVEGKQTTSGIFAGEREFLTKTLAGCDFGFSPCKKVCGNTWDVSGAIGYQIRSCDDDFMFAPVLGYAYNKIDMHTNRNEFFNSDPNFLSSLLSLVDLEISEVAGGSKTCYKGHWTGPYLGFDAVYRVNCCLDLYTSFEYHWAGYCADSHIRNNFALTLAADGGTPEVLSLATNHEVDFKHDACGRGLFWNFGGNYNFCKCWTAGFKFSWVDWKTFKNGRIRAKALNELEIELPSGLGPIPPINGEIETLYCKDTQLNQVRWNSYRIEFTLGYDF